MDEAIKVYIEGGVVVSQKFPLDHDEMHEQHENLGKFFFKKKKNINEINERMKWNKQTFKTNKKEIIIIITSKDKINNENQTVKDKQN